MFDLLIIILLGSQQIRWIYAKVSHDDVKAKAYVYVGMYVCVCVFALMF